MKDYGFCLQGGGLTEPELSLTPIPVNAPGEAHMVEWPAPSRPHST